MRIRLGVLDHDEKYGTRLADYFDAHYPSQIELSLFASSEELYQFVHNRGRLDLLLSDVDSLDWEILPSKMLVALLSSENSLQFQDGIPVIFRYQKAADIFRAVQKLAADIDTGGRSYSLEGRGSLVTFFGAVGGVGCSTVAMGCAARLAAKGKKVLYLSLQQNSCPSEVFKVCGASLTQIRYEMKTWLQMGGDDIGRLQLKLQSLLQTDPGTRVMTFDAYGLPLDAMDMAEKEVALLIEAVLPLCDCCILDIDGIFSGSLLAAIRRSSWSVLVSDGTSRSLRCVKRTLDALNVQDSMEEAILQGSLGVLYNRFGSAAQEIELPPHAVMLGHIPNYSGAPVQRIVEELTGSNVFALLED